MIRTCLAIALSGILALPVHGQGIGDFDCVSTLDGGDSPAGLLRVDEPTRFSFIDMKRGTAGPAYPMAFTPPEVVDFDDAFADHVSPGAIMVEAAWFEDSAAYEAVILTADGELAVVYCPYIP